MSDGPAEVTTRLSLAQRGLRGAAWSYGGAALVIAAQLAYTALTARLISPAEFGAYAAAQALLSIVGYFTLATVGNALIRHLSLDREVVGTALVLTAAAGAIVAAAVLATADAWSDLWQAPGSATLVRIFAPQVLFASIAIAPLGLLRRELRYRAATLIETSSVLLGFAVGGILAARLRTAEALVAGQVAAAAALMVLAVFSTRKQLAIAFSPRHARELFSFSAQVSLQNLGHYISNTLPSLAVSRSLGQASLGFFSRASLLVGLPLTFLAQGATKTLYPIYPRFRTSSKDECRRMMADVVCVTTTIVWPLFAALAGLGSLVVELLLGPEWSAVTPLIAPLCLYAAVNFAYALVGSFAEAFGYLRRIWLVQLSWTSVLLLSLWLAVRADADMRTLVLVAVGVQIAVHALQVGVLAQLGTIGLRGTIAAEAWAMAVATVWYIATAMVTNGLSEATVATRVAGSLGIGAALAAGTWFLLPHLPAGRALVRRGIRIPLTRDPARTS